MSAVYYGLRTLLIYLMHACAVIRDEADYVNKHGNKRNVTKKCEDTKHYHTSHLKRHFIFIPSDESAEEGRFISTPTNRR